MNVTANLNVQNRDYSSVESHNNRGKTTGNKNIDWSLERYDILNQRPINYHDLMTEHLFRYVLSHDKKSYEHGNYKRLFVPKKFFKPMIKYHQKWTTAEKKAAVLFMLNKKNKRPYRTIVFGFGSGDDRVTIEDKLKRAGYSEGQILTGEAHAINSSVKRFNSINSPLRITDYAIHVDERKHHMGQIHGQGRLAFLGHTRSGKPSFNFNRSVQIFVDNHLADLKKIAQATPDLSHGASFDVEKLHPVKHTKTGKVSRYKSGKPKCRTDNRAYFSAFRLLVDHNTYECTARYLEQHFPEANLHFQFVRTGKDSSVSHDRYELNQEARSTDEMFNVATRKSISASETSASVASASASISRAKSSVAVVSASAFSASSFASSAVSAVSSQASSANSRASSADSAMSLVERADRIAHRFNNRAGFVDKYNYLKGFDESDVDNYNKAPSPINALLTETLPRAEAVIGDIKTRFKKWFKHTADRYWNHREIFHANVDKEKQNLMNFLSNPKNLGSQKSEPKSKLKSKSHYFHNDNGREL